MRRLVIGLAILLFIATAAFAQSGTYVRQSGPSVTPNTIPYWVTNGIVTGGVTAADSPVSSFGVTASNQLGICDNSARSFESGWIGLCFGYVSGIPTISVQNYGNATPQPLQFIVNGTVYPFPGALTGFSIGTTSIIGGLNNAILYDNAGFAGTISSVANAVVVTNSLGIPSESATLPIGLIIPSPSFTGSNFINLSNVQQITTHTLLGNSTAGLNNVQQLNLDPTLSFSGTTVACTTATSTQNGCIHPDNVTITVNGVGQLTAVGAVASSIDAGGSTAVTNGKPRDFLFQGTTAVSHTGLPYIAFASISGAL